jgi:hypothetical protein
MEVIMTKKKKNSKKKNYITVSEIALNHDVDQSYLNKTIKKHGIKIVKVKRAREGEDGKVVNAVTKSDYEKLLKLQPNLTAEEATKNDVSVLTATEQLNISLKTLRSAATKHGWTFESKLVNGRTRKTLTKKQVETIRKERHQVITLDT